MRGWVLMLVGSVGFIGAGNLAGAIINGIIDQGYIIQSKCFVFDVIPQKAQEVTPHPVHICASPGEVAAQADYIFLTVKPQIYEQAIGQIKHLLDDTKVLVSVAAGMPTARIKQFAGCDCKVIRTMPNTPILLGQGAVALAKTPPVTNDEFDYVLNLFNAVGKAAVIDEAQMDAIIAVNGSSPAYFFLFAKAVTDFAAGQGIDHETALALFCQTMIGSAHMLLDAGKSPEELIQMVASPNGTTEAALKSFAATGFVQGIADAMAACTNRAIELGQ